MAYGVSQSKAYETHDEIMILWEVLIMYKKVIFPIFILMLAVALTACGGQSSGGKASDSAGATGSANSAKSGNSEGPVIESVSPQNGTGGDIVDLNVNYDASKYGRDDFVVLLDGEKISLTTKYLSGKQFEFALPLNLEAGNKRLAVELGGKASNEVEFEILPPEITAISLSEISFAYMSEATIEISGSNLGFSPDNIGVTLGGQALKVDAVSKDKIIVIVQKGASSGALIVSVNGKEIKTFQVTVKAS